MTRYPLGAVTGFCPGFLHPPLTHIPPVAYTEAEDFILCSIRRRAEVDPLPPHPTLPCILETWVDQKNGLPCSILPLFPRPLRFFFFFFSFIRFSFFSLLLTALSLTDGFRSPLSPSHNHFATIALSHIALVTLLYAF